jgi:hypothetical protein
MLGFAAACAALGAFIAVGTVSLCAGYILAVTVLDRFSKTVLGTHVRHFFVRIAPAKRFEDGDQAYIRRIILDDLKRNGSKIREALRRD